MLARRSQLVAAVDPAELSDATRGLPNVVHVQKSSETAVDDLTALFATVPVSTIVCDMNQPMRACVAAVAPLLPLLQPGGWLVMTCKMGGIGRDRCALARPHLSRPRMTTATSKHASGRRHSIAGQLSEHWQHCLPHVSDAWRSSELCREPGSC